MISTANACASTAALILQLGVLIELLHYVYILYQQGTVAVRVHFPSYTYYIYKYNVRRCCGHMRYTSTVSSAKEEKVLSQALQRNGYPKKLIHKQTCLLADDGLHMTVTPVDL